MKIQALDIRVGDRIVAYFNTKMQVCTVQYILIPVRPISRYQSSLAIGYRYAASRIVRFRPDALSS